MEDVTQEGIEESTPDHRVDISEAETGLPEGTAGEMEIGRDVDIAPLSRSLRGAGRTLLRGAREVAETIVPAIIIALIINLFLAQATQVLGQSMEPNLHTNQRVVVEKVSYRFHGPRRGDVVVIDLNPERQDDDMLIKRVISLPGETLEVRQGQVYIDGKLLQEPWSVRMGGGNFGPYDVPPLEVFVMGDNRGASNDSRSFGAVHIDRIVGRAWFSYWPPEHLGVVE